MASRELDATTSSTSPYKFVEIGANLLDERFTEGVYHGKARHAPDLEAVLERAQQSGVTHMVLTAGTLRESKRAVQWVRDLRQKQLNIIFGCTVGVHPTRCQQEFVDALTDDNNDTYTSSEDILQALQAIALDGIQDGSLVSIGEIGLDYDRLEFCSKEIQQEYLQKQLEVLTTPDNGLGDLPLFLHNRNVGEDLLRALESTGRTYRGVVHSFDDSLDLALKFVSKGFYIGLNGCSLKTEENLAVVKELPLDKILLETDCPYCEIKATHAGFGFIKTKWEKKVEKKFELGKMVKARNEPCQIVQVAEVIAGVKGVSIKEVVDTCYASSMEFYKCSWQ